MSVVVADLFVGYGGVMGGVRAAALLALIIRSYVLSVVGRIVVALMEVVRASFAVVCDSRNGGGGGDGEWRFADLVSMPSFEGVVSSIFLDRS